MHKQYLIKIEAKKYKSAEDFVEAQGEPLYHGTASEFENFDTAKFGKGVRWNNQGKGIYLTDNNPAANMFANVAKQNEIFGDNSLKADEQLAKVGLVTSGKIPGIVKEYYLKPGTKILDMDNDLINKQEALSILKEAGLDKKIMLSGDSWFDVIKKSWEKKNSVTAKEIIEQLQYSDKIINSYEFLAKKLDYDGIKLPDERMATWDYWRPEFGEFPKELPSTTIIYNIDKVLTKSQLIDIWNQANKQTPKGDFKQPSPEGMSPTETFELTNPANEIGKKLQELTKIYLLHLQTHNFQLVIGVWIII